MEFSKLILYWETFLEGRVLSIDIEPGSNGLPAGGTPANFVSLINNKNELKVA